MEAAYDLLQASSIQDLLASLQRQENIINQERGKYGDRDRRKTAERKARQIRSKLLTETDPTLVYLYLKTTGFANADSFRTAWQEDFKTTNVWKQIPYSNESELPAGIYSPEPPDLSKFPVGSFWLRMAIKLKIPYISRNDTDFYIIDNPVQREKVFRMPMVRSTAWKGMLRAAFWRMGYKEDDPVTIHLFGSPKGEEENFRAGRLQFYTSFFPETQLEIINPHSRKTKTGKNPIVLETAKRGSSSVFHLLYFPFDQIGTDSQKTCEEALRYLLLIAKGLEETFTIYGFGAKTSSGYGLADIGQGEFTIAMPDITSPTIESEKAQPGDAFLKEVSNFLQRFQLDEFPQWTNDDLKTSGWGKKRQSEYKRLRAMHPDWDKKNRVWKSQNIEAEDATVNEISPTTHRKFNNYDDLKQKIAQLLPKGSSYE